MDKPTFSDIMKFLNNIFIPVFIPFAFWFIKEYIPKQIELGIQEKLQSRKSEFTKLEYNFQLYTQKQHKIFLEFHQLYCEAKGRIMYLTGVQSLPNFQTYTLKDLEIWFDQQKLVFLETDKKSILTLFETNESASINKLHTLIDKMNERLAQNSLINAHNFALENVLYIPDDIFDLSQILFEDLNKYRVYYGEREHKQNIPNIHEHIQQQHQIRDNIQNNFAEITKKIKIHMKKGSLV